MPHVSDGELHMILDGALELLPDERVRAVRSHLVDCEDCAGRLKRERAVRERAGEILRSAGPDEPGAPDLDELRERAGAAGSAGPDPGNGRRLQLYRGLAWAASLILALGIGWYAGGGPAERLPDAPAAEEDVAEADPTEAPSAARAARETPEAEEPEITAAAEPGVPAAGERSGPDSATASLTVPDLSVLAVAWDEQAADDERPVLRILQALPSGDTLSLVYTTLEDGEREPERVLGLDAAAPATNTGSAAREPGEPSRSEESRRRVVGDRWIVDARAPLPPDSLRALLRRIDPLPEGG